MFGDYCILILLCSIRFPDPAIKVNDTVKIDLTTGMSWGSTFENMTATAS